MRSHNLVDGSNSSQLTNLNLMMFGWLSFLSCRMSVSLALRTFLTATGSSFSCPRNTAPWAPLPSQRRSDISSNGISQLPGYFNTHSKSKDWQQQQHIRDVYGDDGIPRNSWEICGCGHKCCRNPAGIEVSLAGIQRGWNKFPQINYIDLLRTWTRNKILLYRSYYYVIRLCSGCSDVKVLLSLACFVHNYM